MYLLIIAALFTYTNAPSVEMREEPSAETKMASGSYYSEPVEILSEQGDWAQVQTPDGYKGWAKRSAFLQTEQKHLENAKTIAKVNRLAVHLYHVKDTEYGPIKTLPFESKLEVLDQFDDPNGRWLQVRLLDGTTAYIQRGDIELNPQTINKDEMLLLSTKFLGLPYTYGGRSSFGYDCSGFVQMLYRQMGIAIPRNSSHQAAWDGFKEITVEALQPGDLIFWGVEAPKINHVGMYLGQGRFIHAQVLQNRPYVSISSLNDPEWNGANRLKNRQFRTLKN